MSVHARRPDPGVVSGGASNLERVITSLREQLEAERREVERLRSVLDVLESLWLSRPKEAKDV